MLGHADVSFVEFGRVGHDARTTLRWISVTTRSPCGGFLSRGSSEGTLPFQSGVNVFIVCGVVNVALTTHLAHRLVLAAGITYGVLFNLLYWRAHTRGRRCVWLALLLGLLKREHLWRRRLDDHFKLGLDRIDCI